MIRLRPLYRLTLWCAALTLLAGCAAPPGPTPSSTPAAVTTIAFAVPDELVATYEPLVATFQTREPTIAIRLNAMGDLLGGQLDPSTPEGLRRLVETADVMALQYPHAPTLRAELVADLTPLIDADPSFDRGDYFPAAGVAPGARLAALPALLEVPLLHYNQELWSQAGLVPPAPEWSWADLQRAAVALASVEGGTVAVAGLLDWPPTVDVLREELDAAGLRLSPNGPALDDPGVVALAERILAEARAGTVRLPNPARDTTRETSVWIRAGQVAIWPADALNSVQVPAFPVGSAVAPGLTANVSLGYCISAGSANAAAAWRWIAFLSEQRITFTDRAPSLPRVPARRSLTEQPDTWTNLDAAVVAAVRHTLELPPAPERAEDASRVAALRGALTAALAGEPLAAALANAARDTTSSVAATAPTPTMAPPVVETPAPAPAGQITIRFADLYADQAWLNAVAARFMREHDTVRLVIRDETSSGNLSIETLADEFDCFVWGSLGSEQRVHVQPLDPLMAADSTFAAQDYPAGFFAPFQPDSATYALPLAVRPLMIAYRPELFERLGVVPPEAGWRADELVGAATRLTTSATPATYGFADASIDALNMLLRSRGVTLLTATADGPTPRFTAPETIAALQQYIELRRDASPDTRLIGFRPSNLPDPDYTPLITEGRAAIWLNLGFPLTANPARTWEQLAVPGAAVAPPLVTGRGASGGDAFVLGGYVSAQSMAPQLCWDWLRFLAEQPRDVDRYGTFPTHRRVAAEAALPAGAPQGAAEAFAAVQALYEQPLTREAWVAPGAPSAELYWFYRAVDRALRGDNLEQELIDAQFFTEQHTACVRSGEAWNVCARQVDPSYDGWQQ